MTRKSTRAKLFVNEERNPPTFVPKDPRKQSYRTSTERLNHMPYDNTSKIF
jgi:hypothetical protein